jgi:hypothetical protein
MEKNKLLLLPFFAGLVLMVYSWCISYPLSINSVDDVIFNHVPVLYWISLPLLLTSMCMMALSFKNNYWKWIMAVGCVITLYSLFYFYNTLPTSDAGYFRGLTENFIRTKNLDPSQPSHSYYQWPSFFILANIATLVSGFELATYEFLLFTIIGFLLATALYVYATKAYTHGGFLAVVAFFIVMFYFLNYQAVPFSLALGLLFLLFMLETQRKSGSVILAMLVLYVSISITHAFVPLFFVLYLLMRSIVSRSKQYLNLFILTSIIYFLVQFTLAQFSFPNTIISIMTFPTEYSRIINSTLTPASVATDVVAQAFSRTVTIVFAMICLAGFVFIVIKRKMREMDKAVFLTGAVYSGLGVVIYTLGSRALPVVFIPISLGVLYLYESKLRPYLKCFVLILLVLFVFVPLHVSFSNSQTILTKEAYQTENFMIDHCNWTNPSLILADAEAQGYLTSKQSSIAYFKNDFSPLFPSLKDYDCIVDTIALSERLIRYNYTREKIFQENTINVIYNNGFSSVEMKSTNFTWTMGR